MTDVNTTNPLLIPYQTGSYLVYDVAGASDNFRSALELEDRPYRASGSHQLDVPGFAGVFDDEVFPHDPRVLWVVDLRQETHGFFDELAVSWYADNDFSNVGKSPTLIQSEELARLGAYSGQTAQIFALESDSNDNRAQDRVLPISYTDVPVYSARDESRALDSVAQTFEIMIGYARIPVTDHCAPSAEAIATLKDFFTRVENDDWVHFHCHGGDGRTTSFLAMWDMLCWHKSGDDLPALEVFADRQCELFEYCLQPGGCACGEATTGWKLPLAEARWDALQAVRDSLV